MKTPVCFQRKQRKITTARSGSQPEAILGFLDSLHSAPLDGMGP